MGTSPSYQHYRVARALDKFHREFGCETHFSYHAEDLVHFIQADCGLDVDIQALHSVSGKVLVQYSLGHGAVTYEVDTSMCMETWQNTAKFHRWRATNFFGQADTSIA